LEKYEAMKKKCDELEHHKFGFDDDHHEDLFGDDYDEYI
jgi:hypothetical protein